MEVNKLMTINKHLQNINKKLLSKKIEIHYLEIYFFAKFSLTSDSPRLLIHLII